MPTFNKESVKGLDAVFDSFADACFTYLNHTGVADDRRVIDEDMVRLFCKANKIPFCTLKTEDKMPAHHYFPETQWLKNFLEKHGFFSTSPGFFFKVNNSNIPIASVSIGSSPVRNFNIYFVGDRDLAMELSELINANTKADEIEEVKPFFYEIVKSTGVSMFGSSVRESLKPEHGTVDNVRIAHNAFYPYLDGGITALLEDFIASDESVLIIMGEPGTGKTSAVSAAITALGLMPIYAKKTEVLEHPDFVSTAFSLSDQYMDAVDGSKASNRSMMFNERHLLNEEFPRYFNFSEVLVGEDSDKSKVPLIPVIVVEDADILLATRDSGNKAMAELLNCTDGIGSNYSRKIIFNTNLLDKSKIDAALMREGRCYDVLHFRLLTPMEAIEARAVGNLPPFKVTPTEPVSLAFALRKPRKRIYFEDGAPVLKDAVRH